MRTIFIILFLISTAGVTVAQTVTVEKRTSRDSATGKTTVSFDTIVGVEENVTPINNMILIEPLAYFYRLNLKYYRTFGSSMVGAVGADYGWLSGLINNGSSYGFNAEVRFYTAKKAPHGFYVAPNVSIDVAKGTDYNLDFNGNLQTSTVTMMTIGALAGWQWFLSDNFAIGLALGFDDYIHVSGPTDTFTFATLYGSSITGILPVLRFDIGYGW